MITNKTDLWIYTVNHGYLTPDWHWKNRQEEKWRGWLLWFIAGGNGKLTLPRLNKTIPLNRGQFLLLPLACECVGHHDRHNTLIVPWLIFDMFDEKGIRIEKLGDEVPFSRFSTEPQMLHELLKRCINSYNNHNHEAAYLWLRAVLLEGMNLPERKTFNGWEQEQWEKIESIVKNIHENPGKPHHVDKMAGEMGCGRDHFIRLFKRFRGTTPKEFVLQERIEAAKNLLLFSNNDIGTIAENLGYRDQFFFSSQFKKRTGFSPSMFKEYLRRQSIRE